MRYYAHLYEKNGQSHKVFYYLNDALEWAPYMAKKRGATGWSVLDETGQERGSSKQQEATEEER